MGLEFLLGRCMGTVHPDLGVQEESVGWSGLKSLQGLRTSSLHLLWLGDKQERGNRGWATEMVLLQQKSQGSPFCTLVRVNVRVAYLIMHIAPSKANSQRTI